MTHEAKTTPAADAGPVDQGVKPLPPAWRLVGRANPFVPWVTLQNCWILEDACERAATLKRTGKFYAVHVRAN